MGYYSVLLCLQDEYCWSVYAWSISCVHTSFLYRFDVVVAAAAATL